MAAPETPVGAESIQPEGYGTGGPILSFGPATTTESAEIELTRMAAERMADSILQSPRLEQFIAGPPFDGHKCEDGLTVGQFLARRCFAIARDFREELGRIEKAEFGKLAACKA